MTNPIERKPVKFEPDENGFLPVKIHYRLFPVMPFGKHKGELIDKLPVTYLKWIAKGSLGYYYQQLAEAAMRRDSEPPSPEDCVAIRGYDDECVAVEAAFELKDDIKSIPGSKWSPEDRTWLIPHESISVLRKMYKQVKILNRVSERVQQVCGVQQTLF